MNNLKTCLMVQASFWKISLSPVSGIFSLVFLKFFILKEPS